METVIKRNAVQLDAFRTLECALQSKAENDFLARQSKTKTKPIFFLNESKLREITKLGS